MFCGIEATRSATSCLAGPNPKAGPLCGTSPRMDCRPRPPKASGRAALRLIVLLLLLCSLSLLLLISILIPLSLFERPPGCRRTPGPAAARASSGCPSGGRGAAASAPICVDLCIIVCMLNNYVMFVVVMCVYTYICWYLLVMKCYYEVVICC